MLAIVCLKLLNVNSHMAGKQRKAYATFSSTHGELCRVQRAIFLSVLFQQKTKKEPKKLLFAAIAHRPRISYSPMKCHNTKKPSLTANSKHIHAFWGFGKGPWEPTKTQLCALCTIKTANYIRQGFKNEKKDGPFPPQCSQNFCVLQSILRTT